jgi:hypothetical protein
MNLSSTSGQTFRSLRQHGNIWLFFAGQSISISGTWIQNIAQARLILELTHSPVGSPLALSALGTGTLDELRNPGERRRAVHVECT